jgi:hypothetical protein
MTVALQQTSPVVVHQVLSSKSMAASSLAVELLSHRGPASAKEWIDKLLSKRLVFLRSAPAGMAATPLSGVPGSPSDSNVDLAVCAIACPSLISYD